MAMAKAVRNNIHRLSSSLAIALFCAAAPAQAQVYCGPETITKSITYGNGMVMIHAPWRGDWIYICNIDSSWKGISPSVCFGWFSKINTAISESKKIMIYYPDVTDCATMPTYSDAPAPAYVAFYGQ